MSNLSKKQKLNLIDELDKRLDAVEYQERNTLVRLGTDTRTMIRRIFGQESVQMHDFNQIRVEPDGVIANSENRIMTDAWNSGMTTWKELLRGMRTEIETFNEPEPTTQEITIPWILKHMPWALWTIFFGLIAATFLLGTKMGQVSWVKTILGF